jgi:pimeloyl-ACP methyl ester carboxylesterase
MPDAATYTRSMSAGSQRISRPSRWLLAAEGPRALGEFVWSQAAGPLLANAPRGDGHRVLVLPGLGADDRSTVRLRRFLAGLGHRVFGWGLGTNMPSRQVVVGLRDRVADLRSQEPGPISLVGWSLGGIYAREIARSFPETVRMVVTLGSPFRAEPGYERAGRPLQVPSTSVMSRTDGIVPWQACVNHQGPSQETIEVLGSHCGLGHHPAVLVVVADRLAQAPGEWRPMRIPAPWRPVLRHHVGDPGAAPPGPDGPREDTSRNRSA